MKTSLFSFFIVFFFFSCGQSSENLAFTSVEIVFSDFSNPEIEVIQAVLDSAKCCSAKPPPFPPFELSLSNEEFDLYQDSLFNIAHKKWLSTTFEFIVNDTLLPLRFDFYDEFLDSSFIFDSLDFPFSNDLKIFDLKLIKQNGFKLLDFPPKDSLFQDNMREIFKREEFNSVYHFSKMLFNIDKTQVIFYYTKVCGQYCAGGYLVKMKNTDGKWEEVISVCDMVG